MSFPPSDFNRTEDTVKFFLSCCNQFAHDTEYNESPWCLTCGNVISLLNCPSQIKYYGHLRFYWEGNREIYIQTIKPLLRRMHTSLSFRKLKLEELHQKLH